MVIHQNHLNLMVEIRTWTPPTVRVHYHLMLIPRHGDHCSCDQRMVMIHGHCHEQYVSSCNAFLLMDQMAHFHNLMMTMVSFVTFDSMTVMRMMRSGSLNRMESTMIVHDVQMDLTLVIVIRWLLLSCMHLNHHFVRMTGMGMIQVASNQIDVHHHYLKVALGTS